MKKLLYTTPLLVALSCLAAAAPCQTGPSFTPRAVVQPGTQFSLPALLAAQAQQIRLLTARVAGLQGATPSAPASVAFGQPIANRTGGLAVCHVQLSSRAWANGSQDGYLAKITKQRDMGFDAASLDDGANTPEYLQNRTRYYAACDQFNATNQGAVNRWGVGDFKLFETIDLATFPYTSLDVLSVLTPVLKDPANLLFQGKPVYSTYAGGKFGTQANLKAFWVGVNTSLRAQGITPCFIPGFETTDTNCNRIPNTPANCAAMATYLKTFADGWWQYTVGSPLTQDSSLPTDEVRNAAAANAGLIVMTSQIGEYWAMRHSQATDGTARFYQEYYGGEGIAADWKSVLARPLPLLSQAPTGRPQIVQFLTWDDYDEGSNIDDHDVGPGSAWPYLFRSFVPGYYLSKAGKVAEWQLGLHEYKSGLPPKFTHDTLIVFYRTQTKTCVLGTTLAGALIDPIGPVTYVSAENGPSDTATGPGFEDIACITCAFSQSQTVTWTIGAKSWVRSVPAGVTHLRVPFTAGQPTLTAVALNGGSFSVPNLAPIVDHADYANANVFSATANY